MSRARAHARGPRGPAREPGALTALIVHGAWIDASAWREVVGYLQAAGLSVAAVQNPLSSLGADVDAATRAINQLPPPILLVGHGYGGTVITQAGNHPNVAGLVYVAAFAPDAGESTRDQSQSYPPQACLAGLEIDAGGFLYLTLESVAEFLAHDLPATDIRVLSATQQPIRASLLLERVSQAAWRRKPCWYVLTREDRMLSPLVQRAIAKKINARVLEVPAGHAPCLSMPRQTAEAIRTAANSVQGGTVR